MKKNWYRSKTVWVAVVTGLVGVSQALGAVIPEWLYTVLAAAGVYGFRDALK